jgi:hypothetical protein
MREFEMMEAGRRSEALLIPCGLRALCAADGE